MRTDLHLHTYPEIENFHAIANRKYADYICETIRNPLWNLRNTKCDIQCIDFFKALARTLNYFEDNGLITAPTVKEYYDSFVVARINIELDSFFESYTLPFLSLANKIKKQVNAIPQYQIANQFFNFYDFEKLKNFALQQDHGDSNELNDAIKPLQQYVRKIEEKRNFQGSCLHLFHFSLGEYKNPHEKMLEWHVPTPSSYLITCDPSGTWVENIAHIHEFIGRSNFNDLLKFFLEDSNLCETAFINALMQLFTCLESRGYLNTPTTHQCFDFMTFQKLYFLINEINQRYNVDLSQQSDLLKSHIKNLPWYKDMELYTSFFQENKLSELINNYDGRYGADFLNDIPLLRGFINVNHNSTIEFSLNALNRRLKETLKYHLKYTKNKAALRFKPTNRPLVAQ